MRRRSCVSAVLFQSDGPALGTCYDRTGTKQSACDISIFVALCWYELNLNRLALYVFAKTPAVQRYCTILR